MNGHLTKFHSAERITSDEFDALEVVMATKEGPKGSYVVIQEDILQVGFREESLFEARLGLLNSSIVLLGDEHMRKCERSYFFKYEGKQNPYTRGVIEIFERAEYLCKMPGSTLVRQQMLRNSENVVTSKVWIPIQSSTHSNYAVNVANFVYFCNKSPWDQSGKKTFANVEECLLWVLTEEHKSISQTFMTR